MRILVSSALLASSFFSVAGGILANAALSGANTVMFEAEVVQPGSGVPAPHPLPPGVDAARGGQRGLLPRAVVRADLDRGDALGRRPGPARHRDAAGLDL